MTIFLLFPFSRLVHVWSGFATLAYLFRPYQVVRSRRLNLPAGHNQPRALESQDRSCLTTHRRINGVALHAPGEALSAEELRQRACTELLRQAAQAAGLLAASDARLRRRRDQRGGSRRDRGAARAQAQGARAVGRSLPPPLRGA